MNLMGMLKRGDKLDKAFDELQSGMTDVLQEDLLGFDDLAPPIAEDMPAPIEAPAEGSAKLYLAEEDPEAGKRVTTHTQGRLGELASFVELYQNAQEHLQGINAKLSEIITSHHLTREFLNGVEADIHRANEFEVANAAFAAENRRLAEQLHDTAKKLQEVEGTVEVLQRRELGLQQDKDQLRIQLSAVKLELVEAGNALARSEAERGEFAKSLAARSVEAERRLRENEILREKQINLSLDLDKALKREAEARRKFDEISAVHTNEGARYTETLATLAKSEKELFRLQKQLEVANAKQVELTEQLRTLEAENDAETKRNLAETRGLRSEIQSLNSRLELASNELIEATGEISRLKAQLDDMLAEKQVLEEKLTTLRKENENDKRSLSQASANLSQMSLQQASEQMQLDLHRQEREEMRAEIEELAAQVKKLLPYERLYRAQKAKQRGGSAEGASAAKVAARSARPTARPA